jgi:peptide chain release factor 1
MIPLKTVEDLILKHSLLEKELSSGEVEKNSLQKNQKNILT